MIIKLYNRWGMENDSYIFPDDIFSIEGFGTDNIEDCSILEAYAIERIHTLDLPNDTPIELYVNKGLNFALVSILNVFARLERTISVCYCDRETGRYYGQLLEPRKIPLSSDPGTEDLQLVAGRHILDMDPIYGGSCMDGPGIKPELLFSFDELEKIAEQKISSTGPGTIRLYSTGMSQCLVSVVKACRRSGKKLIVMQYNTDTNGYFEQECM